MATISCSSSPTTFAAAAVSSSSSTTKTSAVSFLPASPHSLRFPSISSSKVPRAAAAAAATSPTSFHGLCYVVGDNIDTDQIIPAEYLTLVPSNPSEYEKLGSYALIGLPASYETRFIDPDQTKTKYSIVIAGENFGCGSSREHAPVALGAAGVAAVVAQSYARIFFRNSVATGEVYPLDTEVRVCEECRTGDVLTIELAESRLINHTTGKEFVLQPIGDAGPVIEAGGIFAYARKTGMIPSSSDLRCIPVLGFVVDELVVEIFEISSSLTRYGGIMNVADRSYLVAPDSHSSLPGRIAARDVFAMLKFLGFRFRIVSVSELEARSIPLFFMSTNQFTRLLNVFKTVLFQYVLQCNFVLLSRFKNYPF
ncbi:3-isopropylmalate dehydratase small subunit 1 [Linum perenne]